MISYEEFIVIHTLHKKGYSIRKIAQIVGLDRRTVSKRLNEDSFGKYKQRRYKSKIDPFKEYIQKRVKQAHPNKIPSTVICKEIKKYGYEGGVRTVQRYLAQISSNSQEKEKIIRFETDPGFQAQVDWTVIRSGKNPIYAFIMVLGYSRIAFVYFTDNMKQETFQKCHIKAFEYFGGVTKTILYDNLKSVVIQRDKYGKGEHGFNKEFLDFSKDNFVPKLCKPYRAKTKGKVERFIRYLKENFYIPLKSSLKGSSIDIDIEFLNTKIFSWLQEANSRVHQTTKKVPAELFKEEKEFLTPFYLSIFDKKSNNKNKNTQLNNPISNNKKEQKPVVDNIDITYHTTINDYETLLKGASNAAA
jgi:transposase